MAKKKLSKQRIYMLVLNIVLKNWKVFWENFTLVRENQTESNEIENSLAKHKVTYESIFKEKRGIDILSDAVFHEDDEVFEVVSVMLHNELIHLRTTFVLCVI